MKPFSALYYIKENKRKSSVIIFMLILTTFIFLAGNYIDSVYYYWDAYLGYTDKLCVITVVSTDEDYKDFTSLYEDLKNDDRFTVQPRTARGYLGLPWTCTLGFEMGTASMVFDSVDDMKEAFKIFGVDCDYTDLKDYSVVMSETLAKQYGLKKGDVIDSSVDKNIDGEYTLDALIDDESFALYYIIPTEETVLRMNVLSSEYTGHELRDAIASVQGDRKAQVSEPGIDEMARQFTPFFLIFFSGIILLSLVLSIVVNSVITGQYIKRTYEFGVYRAIGMSRGEIYRKCASEILTTDFIAILMGAAAILLFTFMINELHYIPKGMYLPYFSKIGLYGVLLSNLMVVIPTMLLKGRKMSRADVTEF